MLRYIYGTDLDAYPRLKTTMFRDRAAQFGDRLGGMCRSMPRGSSATNTTR